MLVFQLFIIVYLPKDLIVMHNKVKEQEFYNWIYASEINMKVKVKALKDQIRVNRNFVTCDMKRILLNRKLNTLQLHIKSLNLYLFAVLYLFATKINIVLYPVQIINTL